MGSPAAGSGKTTTLITNFASKVPLRTRAEGGQVELELDGSFA